MKKIITCGALIIIATASLAKLYYSNNYDYSSYTFQNGLWHYPAPHHPTQPQASSQAPKLTERKSSPLQKKFPELQQQPATYYPAKPQASCPQASTQPQELPASKPSPIQEEFTEPQPEQQPPRQEQPPSQASGKTYEEQYPKLIIMFTKESCPYCQFMKPIMQEAEAKFGQDIKFLYVDVNQDTQAKNQYGFSTVPQIMYFKDGQKLHEHDSDNKGMTVEQVEAKIRSYFNI